MPPDTFADFLPTLIEARERQGLHRRDVAQRINVSQATIDSWERRHRTPTAVNARRWAAALGVQLPADVTGWFSKEDRADQPRHGTRSGYQWHLRSGNTPACRPCREAANAYAYRRRHRDAPDQEGPGRLG
jgi:transcriptional regulator with XRE-family HTH domain